MLFSGAGAVATIAVLSLIVVKIGPTTRERIVRVLEQRFAGDIDLKELSVSVFPHLRATGTELVVRRNGQPFIRIASFTAEAAFAGLLRRPWHVHRVELEGLQIHVPPRGAGGSAPRRKRKHISPFVIENIVADGTKLEILPRNPEKQPLLFDIQRLRLHSVGADRPMNFHAILRNPKPLGDIQSSGSFGPWQEQDPSQTPVSGDYTFEHADLSVFHGISGMLSSRGKYKGVLERIEVDGETDTPDFTVSAGGHPAGLNTKFHAIVDGTNGDTYLDPVDATFRRSSVRAVGAVHGTKGRKGKTVSLQVSVPNARVEDLLLFAVKSDKPPLTGAISFNTGFELPPGEQDVMDRLILNADFGISGARFTSPNVEQKMSTLSSRSRGETEKTDQNVASNFKGHFTLKNGAANFSNLSFAIPGALVQLNGSYGLRSEALDFRGTVQTQAKLSEMTTGFKSVLLKAIDPLFKRKKAGAVVPITIGGTRGHPSFGLDVGRVVSRK